MDDNSPDGTGKILDELAARHPRVSVIHRSGKLGIGTAHLDGIHYAYDHGYETLVTMDCDFTHPPEDIPRLLELHKTCDVAIGSRHMAGGSLPGWSPLRRFLAKMGHVMTLSLLGMSYDATGAFRVYRLPRIPVAVFDLVKEKGYAFFFESLFILSSNGISIGETPITPPARKYGHSKMSFKEAARSARQVFSLAVKSRLHPSQFRIARQGAMGSMKSAAK
jgi:dolichol-phosphate mannosyltransferase